TNTFSGACQHNLEHFMECADWGHQNLPCALLSLRPYRGSTTGLVMKAFQDPPPVALVRTQCACFFLFPYLHYESTLDAHGSDLITRTGPAGFSAGPYYSCSVGL
ncbi:hypothetical protein BOTBODRAFT_28378, partial [Botryobasidium botryosum FD-172 SS1]